MPKSKRDPATLLASPNLTAAFKAYIQAKHDAKAKGIDWDKTYSTEQVIKTAKAQWGDKMVWFERCAASCFFHIQIHGDNYRGVVYEIHLLDEHQEETKDFTILKRSEWANKKQTIVNGTRMRFNKREWEHELPPNILHHHLQLCTVVALAVAAELGEKDFEYYDIKFDNGAVFKAISGYHLQ